MKIEKNNKNRNKSEEGITLIALIITIIIMLILVAVTIDVVVDGKLFDTAKDAVGQTNNKVGEEQNRVDELMGELENVYNQPDDGEDPPPPPQTMQPGDKAEETEEYEDTNGDIAVIPGGFTVSGVPEESTIEDGLVIYLIPKGETVDWTNPTSVANAQKTYDQFVWIPISHEQINNMYICQAKTGSNGNCNITVENGQAKCATHNSTQMAGRLYATDIGENFEKGHTEVYTPNTGLREPDIVTGNNTGDGTNYDGSNTYLSQLSSILGTTGYDTAENFKQSLQQEYNEVVKSVYENQGFYIGRYETSGMVDDNANATVKSVAGTNTGISNVTWYRMYAQQKKYAKNNQLTSVKSTMIQGAAYDQVMKFVENGERPDGQPYNIKTAENVGHGSSSFTTKPYQTGGRDYSTNYTGTTPYNDKVKNIYDLEGNVRTWTTEADSTIYRVFRGRQFQQQLFSKFSLRRPSELQLRHYRF